MRIAWGIDVGVASLGFAIIELDKAGNPKNLLDGVANVYPAPLGGAERTRYKSMRSQSAHYSKRMKDLRKYLAETFAISADFDTEMPRLLDGVTKDGREKTNNSRVRLREHGLSARLEIDDVARAILHIAKNRGQRLTRGLKDDKEKDEQKKKEIEKDRQSIAAGAKKTKIDLEKLGRALRLPEGESAHPAQLLMQLAKENGGVTRLRKGISDRPVFTRGQMEAELKALLEVQAGFPGHRDILTESVRQKIVGRVFFEHDSPPPRVGLCRYGVMGPDGKVEMRLPRGTHLFQCKRIYEEVNNLRLIDSLTAAQTPLSAAQRDTLVTRLMDGSDLSAAAVRKALDLGKGATAQKTSLDIASRGRKTAGKLNGHPLAAAMAKAGALDFWKAMADEQKEAIAELVRTEDDPEVLKSRLVAQGIEGDAMNALCEAKVPATYSAAGQSATRKLLEQLKAEVISNHEAEIRAGLKTTDGDSLALDRLPYYGEVLAESCVGATDDPDATDEQKYGRIPNPVVHVALNQIRRVANAYLDLYGKPDRICIELARDMNKSSEERDKLENEARKNRAANERYIENVNAHKRRLTPQDMLKLRLHHMQGGECLYTGATIGMGQLFDGSVEIDHILPYADTADDGIANLALAFESANQYKRKRTPFEAFGHGYDGQPYAKILERAFKRGRGVSWRFAEDAKERIKDQEKFRNRFLGDTRYVAKSAARYLGAVCADPNGVICLNGRITSWLRRTWGLSGAIADLMVEDGRLSPEDISRPKGGETLDEIRDRRKRQDKIRFDHRHHLLDAIVAGCVTRSDVQRLQTLAARDTGGRRPEDILAEVRRNEQLFREVGICWRDGFRGTVMDFLRNGPSTHEGERPVTAIVHKPDHDPRGQLHKEGNFGLICAIPGTGQFVARHHARLSDLQKREHIEGIGVPESAIRHVENAFTRKSEFWWGGDDPVSSLRNNLAKDLAEMRERLLELWDETPADKMTSARSESGKDMARTQWAIGEYIRRTGRQRYTVVEAASLRILKGPEKKGKRPRRAAAIKNNDRLIYFINGEGERDWEVVSTLDANTPGFRERWQREGGRPLFVLRQDDLVEMANDPKVPDSGRQLFRVVSFSPTTKSVDAEFLPVNEARAPKEVPEGIRTRVTSLSAFVSRNPVQVLCEPTGRVRWRGPRLN